MRTTAPLAAKLMRIGAALLVVALMSIGLTLWVTWRLSGGAAALNEAGRMRMQTWRMVSTFEARLGEAAVQAQVREFDGSLQLLRQGDSTRPLFVPWDDQVRARYAEVEVAWAGHRALLAGSNDVPPSRLVQSAEGFLTVIDRFVMAIERQLASLTAILNMFQFVMMALAIGGAVVMLYTGYHYVIHPLGQLRDALRRLESAEFSARVEVASNDEFGQVAQGFNRMAATLQSLYGDLEGQVAAKTQRIAAQKERLEALYRVSAFLSQAGTLHELTEGFAAQVRELLKADAVALRWMGDDPGKFLILGSDQFPLDAKEDEKCLRAGVCACGNARTEGRTRVIPIRSSEVAPLQHCNRIGFETLVSVPVRLHNKVLGEIDLFYRREVRLAVEEMELLDALASHLASAVEGMRVAALEREAVISGERALLARGLHDSIAQSLAFLKIQAGLLRSALAKGDAAKTSGALEELDHGLKESMADVRELLVHFRTRAQSDDIEAAVQETLQKFHQQTGLEVQRLVRGEGLPLPQDVQIQVLHVLQEALSNVRKHAQARRVTIEIHKGDRWRFVVADDGRGFDSTAERTQMHVGLKIMQERADHIGATVAIDSRPGEGTRVSLSVPANPGRAPAAAPAAMSQTT